MARNKTTEETLIIAIAGDDTPEQAAKLAGVSEAEVRRLMKTKAFRAHVEAEQAAGLARLFGRAARVFRAEADRLDAAKRKRAAKPKAGSERR